MKKWILNTLLGLSLFAAAQRGGAQGTPITSQTAKIWSNGKAQDAIAKGWEEAIGKISSEYGLSGISLEIMDELAEGAQIVFHEGFKTATIQLDKNFAKTEFPWRYGIVAHEIGHQFLQIEKIRKGESPASLWNKHIRGTTTQAEKRKNEHQTDSVAVYKTMHGKSLQEWLEKRHEDLLSVFGTRLHELVANGYATYDQITRQTGGRTVSESALRIHKIPLPEDFMKKPGAKIMLRICQELGEKPAHSNERSTILVPVNALWMRLKEEIETTMNTKMNHFSYVSRVKNIGTWQQQKMADNAAKDTYRHR